MSNLGLGSLSLVLYVPLLKIIATNTHVEGVGYSKQIDPSGIQQAYQVNHHKTIAQMTLPTQQHTTETKSLGKSLSLLNPATVKSSDAKDYVNAFDPHEHNTPFNYNAAKDAGKNIAPQATATLNENHQGNYTLNHNGTLNTTTQVDAHTEYLEAPQINNVVNNYQGNFSGDTFSKTINNYYEQIENEALNINEHFLEAPTYEESVDQLDEEIENYSVNSQTIFLEGGSFIHNGTMFLNGPFEFCPVGDVSTADNVPKQDSVQPKKTPNNSYAIIPPASDDYYIFLSTVYGESASVPAAWEAVADSIILRATQSSKKLTPGQVVALPWQYDAYINPLSLNFSNIDFSNPLMKNHIQFLKAYDYLAKKTLTMHLPLTAMESKTLASIDIEVRPIYSLYTNKNVLLKPIVLETCSDKSDTCAEKYKQNNPANPLKYYITNYYSPQGQGNAPVSFLADIPKNIDPDEYEVIVPNVTQRQFKFYNLPSDKHH